MYRNNVHKLVVSTTGDLILNRIDQYCFCNESFKVRVQNQTEPITKYMGPVKAKIKKQPDVIIIRVGADDLTVYRRFNKI